MNWRVALIDCFESYGLAAYPENNVPDDVRLPYLTYNFSRGDFGENTNTILHLHYYSESESEINAKAEEICADIRLGRCVSSDDGKIVLTTGSPEWYPVSDEDRLHKHRIINVTTIWILI